MKFVEVGKSGTGFRFNSKPRYSVQKFELKKILIAVLDAVVTLVYLEAYCNGNK